MTFIPSAEKNTDTKSCSPETRKIMVYGSLMEGFFNYDKILSGQIVSCVPARLKGRLYHMNKKGYPALVNGANWVYGELMELTDLESRQYLLDEVEHYFGPMDSRNEYERKVTSVENLATGDMETAYVYWYAADDLDTLDNPAEEVSGGDWRVYMRSVK